MYEVFGTWLNPNEGIMDDFSHEWLYPHVQTEINLISFFRLQFNQNYIVFKMISLNI